METGVGSEGLQHHFSSRSVATTTALLFFPPHAENGRRLHACQYSASPTPPPVLAASEAHRDKVRISTLYLTINTYNNRASRLTCKLGDLQLGRAVVTTDFCIIWILPVSYCNQRQTATLMMVNKRNDG